MSEIIKYKTRLEMIASLHHGAVVAEVGVWRGYFSAQMLDLPNLGRLILIDSWRPRPEYSDPLDGADHETNYRETLKNIGGHLNNPNCRVEVIRCDSREAHKFMAQQPRLSGCFLDADHSYEAVLADLRYWSNFMIPSGLLMGHDFCDQNPMAVEYGWGVQKAVDQFCKESDWKLVAESVEEFPSFCLRRI